MTTRLYLSPHLDDAVYSCGGLMARQAAGGERVRVLTVCAGEPLCIPASPLVRELHLRWGAGPSPIAVRREEDLSACRLLGVEAVHLEVPDAAYRASLSGKPLYPTEGAIFGALDPGDKEVVEALLGALRRWLHDDEVVYCPLAEGGHVDHRLTRAAAEALRIPLCYYHDFPYAARGGQIPPEFGGSSLGDRVERLNPEELESWAAAAARYSSQLSTFWSDRDALRLEILEYHEERGGLHLTGSCEAVGSAA